MSNNTDNYDYEKNQDAFMNALYWYGIPTLFRAPNEPDPSKCDIALVGVPHSTGNGTTERDQHLGPRAVRDVSANGRRVHMKFGLDPWNACQINDLGDVPLTHANNNEKSIEHITEYYQIIDAAGARPVSVGGDHSITGGILQALGGPTSKLTKGEKACILHFDAHTDCFSKMQPIQDTCYLNKLMADKGWLNFKADGEIDWTRTVAAYHPAENGTLSILADPFDTETIIADILDWFEGLGFSGAQVVRLDEHQEVVSKENCYFLIPPDGLRVKANRSVDALCPSAKSGDHCAHSDHPWLKGVLMTSGLPTVVRPHYLHQILKFIEEG